MLQKSALPVEIGISEKDRETIAEGLTKLLAATYGLYFKTHIFHWNVTGPEFQTLHLLFETQYNELWLATDIIAERIRSLGFFVPPAYSDLARLSPIAESKTVPTARDMITEILKGHEAIVRLVREIFQSVEKSGDEASADLLTQRIQLHEKTAWMLRSLG